MTDQHGTSKPRTLLVELPSSDVAEIAHLLAVLDQIVGQLWTHFGPELTDFLLRDFRQRHRTPAVRILDR